MDNLKIMEAIQDSIRILRKAAAEVAGGSMTVWLIVDHAQKHLDKQIAELLTQETTDAHPGYQHNYRNGVCIARGCAARI